MTPAAPRLARLAPLLGFVPALALGQGSDACASPTDISGSGPFAFDTTGATTDGFEEMTAASPGLHQIHEDVWFRWTPAASGAYLLSTCTAQTMIPTALAVYDFGCSSGPGRAQTARGANCGSWTELVFAAEAGVPVLIRVGSTSPASMGTGEITITPAPLPASIGNAVNPASGATYHILEPSSWNVAQAAARAMGGDLVTVNDAAENDWLLQTFWSWGGQPTSFWIGFSDAETEGTFVWASGQTPGYENWSSPPSNSNQAEHYAHFRHDWPNGTWNDLFGDPNTNFFYSTVHGVVEISDLGTNYCAATTNSTGAASSISASGSTSLAADDMVLAADNLPDQPGIFIAGPAQDQIPFFNGFLCVSPNGLQRFVTVNSPAGGVVSQPVSYSTAAAGRPERRRRGQLLLPALEPRPGGRRRRRELQRRPRDRAHALSTRRPGTRGHARRVIGSLTSAPGPEGEGELGPGGPGVTERWRGPARS